MGDFEILLNELTHKIKQEEEKKQQKEVVVAYEEGKENDAGVLNNNAQAEDAYVLLIAAGNLIGRLTGLDGKKIGEMLVENAMEIIIKNVTKYIADGMMDVLKGIIKDE